jgi:uncharacterized iron-regulated membrane protein
MTGIVVFVTAISGLLIAHTGSPDPGAERPLQVKGSGTLADAKPINDPLIASLRAVVDQHLRIISPEGGIRRAGGPAAIERAVFRPASGTVQVLLRDAMPLEVVLDWSTAQVLSVAPRHETRWARIHSGAALGEEGTLLSDALAGVVVLMSLTGIWIWFRDRKRTDLDVAGRWFRHAGLVAGIVLLIPAFINHRAELGFTYRSYREYEAEQIVKMTPALLPAIVDAAVTALARRIPGTRADAVDWIEYFPNHGYVGVRFKDGTDVFASAYSTEVQAIMPPRDSWVRQLHSGRIFGRAGWLWADVTSLLWIGVTFGGIYLMVTTGLRRRTES